MPKTETSVEVGASGGLCYGSALRGYQPPDFTEWCRVTMRDDGCLTAFPTPPDSAFMEIER